MPFNIEAGDVVRVSVFCQMENQLSVNVFAYKRTDSDPVGVSSTDVLPLMSDIIDENYAQLMSFKAKYLGLKMEELSPVSGAAPSYFRDDEDGTITGDPLPGQLCGLISWRTNKKGRSFMGRTYIAFPAESRNEPNTTPSDTYMANLDTLATTLLNLNITVGVVDTTFSLGVWSKQNLQWNQVTEWLSRFKWATQRRRGLFGRPNQGPF